MTCEEFLVKEAADEAVLVDIREDSELAVIPSPARSLHLPLSKITDDSLLAKLPKDKVIVTICHSGGRCGPAGSFLQSRGYTVDAIEGGLISWNA